MGYRWYKGRFLSDDEYHAEVKQNSDNQSRLYGTVISIVVGAIAGFSYYEKDGAIVGAIIGLIVGLKFGKSIFALFAWAIFLYVIYLIFFK